MRSLDKIRFVVIGMPRTGSTLLATGLEQHPNVTCFGELIHPLESERKKVESIVVDGENACFDPERDDAIEFLRTCVYENPTLVSRAVGFKLHGHFAAGRGSHDLLARLRGEIPDLRFIHIKRENYLDVYLSLAIACRDMKWSIFASEGNGQNKSELKRVEPISIQFQEAEKYFFEMNNMDSLFYRLFSGVNYFCVNYADLDRFYEREMSKIYEFLGVESHVARPWVVKQNTSTARDLIMNYDELSERFSNTFFSRFFKEALD